MISMIINPVNQQPLVIEDMTPALCVHGSSSQYFISSKSQVYLVDIIDTLGIQVDPQGKMIKQTKGVTDIKIDIKETIDFEREELRFFRSVFNSSYVQGRTKNSIIQLN